MFDGVGIGSISSSPLEEQEAIVAVVSKQIKNKLKFLIRTLFTYF
jgi:hypothetical protein